MSILLSLFFFIKIPQIFLLRRIIDQNTCGSRFQRWKKNIHVIHVETYMQYFGFSFFQFPAFLLDTLMWSVSYTKSKYTWIFLFSNPHPKCKDFRNRGAQIPRIPHGMCFKSGAQNYQTSIMSIFTSWPPLLVIHLSRISSAS